MDQIDLFPKIIPNAFPDSDYEYITTSERLAEIEFPKIVGVDIETTGLNPRESEIRLIQVGVKDFAWVIDVFRVKDLTPIFSILRSPEHVKIMHNGKFECKFFQHHYDLYIPMIYDTYLCEALATCGDYKPKLGLDKVLERHTGFILPKDEQKSDWGAKYLSGSQLQYAANDISSMFHIRESQLKMLYERGLVKVAQLECDVIQALAHMELSGIHLNVEKWMGVYEVVAQECARLEKEFMRSLQGRCSALPGMGHINLNSPKQVVTLLVNMGYEIKDSRESTLKMIRDDGCEEAGKILEIRKLKKSATTYGKKFIKDYVDPDGRVRAEFTSVKTRTGRTSSRKPNLQNIKAGLDYRSCFEAAPGNKLIICDYSQIELRVAAYMFDDQVMRRAYLDGLDLHTFTGQEMTGKTEISKDDRTHAKIFNFGLIYGMGWRKLRSYAKDTYGVDLTDEEAKAARNKFFNLYEDTAKYHLRMRCRVNKATKSAQEFFAVRTVLGRLRLVKRSNGSNGETYFSLPEVLNAPIQGTAADGMKRALWLLYNRLPAEAKIVNLIHDELVVECPIGSCEGVANLVSECMVNGMQPLIPSVPVIAEPIVSTFWEKD